MSRALGQETRVITNHNTDAESGGLVLEHITRNRSSHAAHVIESKIVGDKAAPAVGAEFDFAHGSSSLVTPGWSHQLMQLLLIQMFHHFTNVLRLVERGNQQRVFGFDNYQIVHADNRNKLTGHVNVIIFCVQGEAS